jgi:rhamnose transport system permease protein
VWIAALTVLAAWYVARHSRFGRDLYAIGNEPSSARYVGIPLARRLLWTYGLSGAMAGLCGYLWVARYAVAYTEIAYGFEFTVIAACVIGGISIAGGCGSVAGAVLGGLFLAVIGNALPVVKVSPFWQSALTGIVILTAVLINARNGKQGGRQILPLHGLNPTGPAA